MSLPRGGTNIGFLKVVDVAFLVPARGKVPLESGAKQRRLCLIPDRKRTHVLGVLQAQPSSFRRLPREAEPFVRKERRNHERDHARPDRNEHALHDDRHAPHNSRQMRQCNQEKYDPGNQ